MSDSNIKISLELVDKAAQKALSDFVTKSETADKSLGKIKDSGKSTFNEIAVSIGKASGVYDIFAGNLAANLTTKAFELLSAGANELFQTFIVDGVKAAQSQEQANQDLNIALAQTGIYSSQTAKEFQDLASEIQATTGISDDAILSNTALIQTLGQLDKDGLKRATNAAIELSAALGKDLASTSEIIGKAAAGNTTALGKLGISFQKGATDAITFNNILNEIETRFSGSAITKVNTYAGSIGFATSAFGELQESVGNTIIQNSVVIELIKSASSIFQDLTSDIDGNKSAFKSLVGEGILTTIDVFIGFAAVADTISRSITASIRAIELVFQGLATGSLKILSLFSDDVKEIADGMASAFLETANSVNTAFTEDTGLGKATELLARLREGAVKGMDALKKGVDVATPSLDTLKGKTSELTDEQLRSNEELTKWVSNLANSTKGGQDQLDAQIEAYRLQKEQLLLADNDFNNANIEAELMFFDQKSLAEQTFFEGQQSRILDAQNKKLATEQQASDASLAIQSKANIAFQKSEIEKQKFQRDIERQKISDTKDTLSTIGTLQSSKSRELFFIGKAAAVANATISTYEGIAKAWALGPILGPPLAALVGVAGFAQVANIVSQQPAFENGGIVGGSSFTGDKISARVNSGEMILNRSQQSELFKMANGKSSDNSVGEKLDTLIGLLAGRSESLTINVGGKTILDTLRSELDAGRSFA